MTLWVAHGVRLQSGQQLAAVNTNTSTFTSINSYVLVKHNTFYGITVSHWNIISNLFYIVSINLAIRETFNYLEDLVLENNWSSVKSLLH